MAFKDLVEKTPHLAGTCKEGLGALRAEDRPHIKAENTRRLHGSVDVDKALQRTYPQANRWDFAIAYQHSDRDAEVIYWVEIHTGSEGEVSVVLKKLRWLLEWLKGEGRELAKLERDIVWVSSGATTFTLNAPKQKEIALHGLKHRGRVLHIRDKRGG